jgi:hypothetical protein
VDAILKAELQQIGSRVCIIGRMNQKWYSDDVRGKAMNCQDQVANLERRLKKQGPFLRFTDALLLLTTGFLITRWILGVVGRTSIVGHPAMAETPKAGDGVAAIPQPVSNPETPTPAGQPVEEEAEYFPWPNYEPPGAKSRFRSFREAYGVYGKWLLYSGLFAFTLGLSAYGLDHEHFWFHVCVELAIASFMLVLTVIFVERMLEYRREQERKERWAMIRRDTFVSLDSVLTFIVLYSVIDLLDEPTPSTEMQDTSSAYYKVAQDLTKKSEALKAARDAAAMQAWAHKMFAWHDTIAPVVNMLRSVTVPHFLHSTGNRTLLRLVLGLEQHICHSEVSMINLRRPDFSRVIDISVTNNLETIARIVRGCGLIRFYLEQAKTCGVKDVDDWTNY